MRYCLQLGVRDPLALTEILLTEKGIVVCGMQVTLYMAVYDADTTGLILCGQAMKTLK